MPQQDTVLHLIHRAQQQADALLQKLAAEHGLTPTQIIVLDAISSNTGVSQAKLCDATGVDRATMTDVVGRMVRKGLLRRVRSKKDSRAYVINLTDQGLTASAIARSIAEAATGELLKELSPSDRDGFLNNLTHMLASRQTVPTHYNN